MLKQLHAMYFAPKNITDANISSQIKDEKMPTERQQTCM